MSSSLKGKAIIVTGGSSGIGKCICIDLAKVGSKVAVVDVNLEQAQNTSAFIKKEYPTTTVTTIQCDVSKSNEVEQMVAEATKALGPLYGAVNCAGIGGGLLHKLVDYPEELFDQMLAVNLKGVFLCMKHELREFVKQGKGNYAIVNISSFSGLRAHRLNAPYAATKHAVLGLTKSAAIEYARAGVRVNAVCPTFTVTPMLTTTFPEGSEGAERLRKAVPVGRFGTPEEVSAATLWLLGNDSSFTTGHALTVDGGISSL